VAEAGGFGFLAAGYRTPEAVADDLRTTRGLTARPFGVNVFVPGEPAPPEAYAAYADRVDAAAREDGAEAGEPRFEDDWWDAKLQLLAEDPVAVVSFTFGCPPPEALADLKAAGSSTWVTVTSREEAAMALAAGADALVAQGAEAGGHRASFVDDPAGEDIGLLALLQLLRAESDAPLVASGGIGTGGGVAAALAAGAGAAQLGTAFMRCPEAGTAEVHRHALAEDAPTRITRAFTGRRARGLVNRFMEEHDAEAPSAYPEVHHLTAPLRAAARAAGDAGGVNLWAGQTHVLAPELPAAELVRRLADEAARALAAAGRTLDPDTP
jgi:nitronate monooxygenase